MSAGDPKGLVALLESPFALGLAELTLGGKAFKPGLSALVQYRPPALRTVKSIPYSHPKGLKGVELRPVLAALPRLRVFESVAQLGEADALESSGLEELSLHTEGKTLPALVASQLPKLERLTLWSTLFREAGKFPLAELMRALEALPLKSLVMNDCWAGAEVTDALAKSSALKQLEHLRFGGTDCQPIAERIAAAGAAFAGLKSLGLQGTKLPDALEAALASLGPEVAFR